MASNESLDTLPPSAKLALLHAQAAASSLESVTTTTNTTTVTNVTEEDKFVPSPDDPVVMDNSHFEPLISGDFPTPIGKKPTTPLKKEVAPSKKNLDLNSEAAFPSLSASPRAPVVSAWSANAASRLKSSPQAPRSRPMAPPATGKKVSGTPVTDVLELPSSQQIANLPNKPLGFKSSADVIQQVINRTGTNIIASTNRSGTTTFLIQGATADVAKARKELIAGLVVKRTVEIGVPSNTRRFIIGAKGANLKQIEAKSGTRINFPRKEDDDFYEEDPEEMVSVTIMGDPAGIKIAKEEIEKIVGEKTAKQTVKVDQFDPKYYLFLAGPHNSNVKKLEEEFDVKIHIPTVTIEGEAKRDAPITISGDKEKVQATKRALENSHNAFTLVQSTVSITVSKRQHKYLHGKNGETLREIFNESECTVELPAQDDPTENVTIRGPNAKLLEGLGIILAKSRSVYIGVLDLTSIYGKDNSVYAYHALRYLLDKKTFRNIENDHNVQISVPSEEELKKGVTVEVISKDEKAAAGAQLAITNIVRKLTPDHFTTAKVDTYLHQHIISSHRGRIERVQETQQVDIIFPDAKTESSEVLVVYEGEDKDAAKEALAAASGALTQIVADSSDYVSKTISIPTKYHDLIRGPKGTTLNAILGTDSDVSVRFKDTIEVRGLSKQVNHAISEINKTYEQAQNEDFAKPYSSEFFIPANFSPHIIGKAGIHINKLKEDLGVKVDMGESTKTEEKVNGKGAKKTAATPVKVTIHGIKTNVEAAKERINSQIASLADQVSLSLKVPRDFHRYLIGPNGRYVKKLEDKYSVFIKFPKTNRGDESPTSGNPDEIIVRGGKKGANAAKDELVELYEYEKEEQDKRKERELKQKQYEERKAEEKAAKESANKQ